MMKKIKTIEVGASIFEENDRIAKENQRIFRENGIFAVNIMGSPGSGKTSLLEKTISQLKGQFSSGVIEGDVKGSLDAERLAALDIPVVQINTGGACHLDAFMVQKGIKELPLKDIDVLFVENVGNLVCPAEFEIGTVLNVVISSVPEGEDKPMKYPLMFQRANICILNKIDLLSYTDFNLEQFTKYLKDTSSAQIIPLSVKTGDGLNIWAEKLSSLAFNWLSEKIEPLSIGWKGRIVIVGMGDRMKGDDGAGSLIAEKLTRTIKRKDIRIIDAGNAIENYIGLIEKFHPDTVVVIDAVDFGGSPGEIKIMDPDELAEFTTSTHTFSLPLLISHIKTETGTRCKVIGIQPKKIGLSENVSQDVQKAIKKLIEDISFELCR